MATWASFILSKMQEREIELGRRVTNKEFGNMLGVSASTISQWLSGKYPPSTEFVPMLADKLGNEVYEVLGFASPEPDLRYVSRNWENLPEDVRRQIREIVDKYVFHK